MKSADQLTGGEGEKIACGYLVQKGYEIINRNFTTPFGEIDIIVKSSDNTLIFIEVKSKYFGKESGNDIWQSYPQSPISTDDQFLPEMRLSFKKIFKLRRLAEWYINSMAQHNEFRIDGVCVDIFKDGLSNIRHYKNIGYY